MTHTLCLLVIMGAGFAASQGQSDTHEIWERYTFAFINDDPESPAFFAVEAGARAAASRLAPPRRLGIALRFLNPRTMDAKHQMDWMRQLYVDGVDGIAVKLNPAINLNEEIDFLGNQNISVIAMGDAASGSTRLAAVKTDNAEAGRLLIQEVGRLLGAHGGAVAVLAGNTDLNSRQERLRGLREALAEIPALSLYGVYECPESMDGSHDVLHKVVREDRNRRIRAWVFLGGWPLQGAAELPWAPGAMVCVSMDALPQMLPYLEADYVQALVAEDFHAWGVQALEWLVSKIHGRKDPAANLLKVAPAILTARGLPAYRELWAQWIR